MGEDCIENLCFGMTCANSHKQKFTGPILLCVVWSMHQKMMKGLVTCTNSCKRKSTGPILLCLVWPIQVKTIRREIERAPARSRIAWRKQSPASEFRVTISTDCGGDVRDSG